MKRSVGITVIATLSLVGSVLTLLLGIALLLVFLFAPIPNQNIPGSPIFFKAIFILSSLIYIFPAIWGVATSVGLYRLKNWARISIIVFSALLIIMCAFGVLTALVMPLPPQSSRPPESAFVFVRWFMGLFALANASIGVWWLVFFTRPKVQIQFVSIPSASPVQIEPSIATQPLLPSVVGNMPRRPRPLSITILAGLLLVGSAFMPISLFFRTPAIFLTQVLTGWPANTLYVCFTAVNLYLGIGLLRLEPTARITAIAYFLFQFVNLSMFYLAPGAQTRMRILMEKQQSMFPWAQAWQGQNPYQVDLKAFVILGTFGALVGVVVPLYFLITRKSAFDRASAVEMP